MKKLFLIPLIFLSGCDYSNKYNTDDECTKENIIKYLAYSNTKPKSYNKNVLQFIEKNILVSFYDTGWFSTSTGAHICYVEYRTPEFGKVKERQESFIQYNYGKEMFEAQRCSYKTIEGKRKLECLDY